MTQRPFVWKDDNFWKARTWGPYKQRQAKKAITNALIARDLADPEDRINIFLVEEQPEFSDFCTEQKFLPRHPKGYKPVLPPTPQVGSFVRIIGESARHRIDLGSVGTVMDVDEGHFLVYGFSRYFGDWRIKWVNPADVALTDEAPVQRVPVEGQMVEVLVARHVWHDLEPGRNGVWEGTAPGWNSWMGRVRVGSRTGIVDVRDVRLIEPARV